MYTAKQVIERVLNDVYPRDNVYQISVARDALEDGLARLAEEETPR